MHADDVAAKHRPAKGSIVDVEAMQFGYQGYAVRRCRKFHRSSVTHFRAGMCPRSELVHSRNPWGGVEEGRGAAKVGRFGKVWAEVPARCDRSGPECRARGAGARRGAARGAGARRARGAYRR